MLLILNATIIQPSQFSYFFHIYGACSASVASKLFSSKKNECIHLLLIFAIKVSRGASGGKNFLQGRQLRKE